MELVYISKFKNIEGVTCYMNSILHILQNIEHFFNFIFSKSISNKNIIHSSLNNLLKNSHNNEDISIIPMELRTNLGIKNSMWTEDIQQDSADFLNFLINELENELCLKASYIPTFKGNLNVMNQNLTYTLINTISARSWHTTFLDKYSELKEIFYGIKQVIRPCVHCNTSSISHDIFNILTVYIPDNVSNINLYDCLNNTMFNEISDNSIKNCTFCGLNSKNINQTKLWITPKILIIQLMKFKNELTKKMININYPINNLNLSPYFNSSSPYFNACEYNLIGINIHTGYSIHSGHYTSIIKNNFNKNWYFYNDDNPIKKINNYNELQNNNAYLLFYELK